jgi:molybdate transport system substrate-binding protein
MEPTPGEEPRRIPTRKSPQRASASLKVLAAGSLRAPFDTLAAEWRRASASAVEVSYDNARALARRIEAGEPTDVFASASPVEPATLHAAGLVDEPRPFAANCLVVAVPAGSEATDARILARPGVRVVIEVEGIPLGDYTRILLDRLDECYEPGFGRAVLTNVVSQEQTVTAVVERLTRGEADAAVLYDTDVAAASDRLRAIRVPVAVRGTYVIATVRDGPAPRAAAAWLALLAGPKGRSVLRAAGFDDPPGA